jgi:hypothetical protein
MAGLPDPRLFMGSHTIDPHLACLVRTYQKLDPAPDHIQPIPLEVLRQACHITQSTADPTSLAAADLKWSTFFYLLCPGKYTNNADGAHPFTLANMCHQAN